MSHDVLMKSQQDQLRVVIANVFDFFIDTFHHMPFDTSIIETTEDDGVYCSILYNDEIHNYDQVINTVSSALGESEERGFRIANNIDNNGMDIIFTGKKSECIEIANKIKTIGLHVIVLQESFIHQQTKAYELMEFVYDLVLGEYNRPNDLQNIMEMILCQELLKAWHTRLDNIDPDLRYVQLDPLYHPTPALDHSNKVAVDSPALVNPSTFSGRISRLLRIVDQDSDGEDDSTFNGVYKGRLTPTCYQLPDSVLDLLPDLKSKSFCHYRIDYVMYYHRKTWKKFRKLLNELIMKSFCFTNTLTEVIDDRIIGKFNNISNYKLQVPITNRRDTFAIQYFKLYPLILWDVLFKEREPYDTLNEIGVQILTVPSIALALESMFNCSFMFCEMLIKSILFNQKQPFSNTVKSDVHSITLPIIDVNKQGISNSIYMKLTHDLLFFINTNDLRKNIQTRIQNNEDNVLRSFIVLSTLVHGMDHQLRYINQHIQFESKSWRWAFNLALNMNILMQELLLVVTDDNIDYTLSLILNAVHHLQSPKTHLNGASIHTTLFRLLSPLVSRYPELFNQLKPTASPIAQLNQYMPFNPSIDPHNTVLHGLIANQVYHDQLISLMWLRNGQIPFYEQSLMKLNRSKLGSLYTSDLQLLQHYYKRYNVFDMYFSLIGPINDNKLLASNILHFVLVLLTPLKNITNEFIHHMLAVKPHLKSELDDYFEQMDYDLDIPSIHSKHTYKGIEYFITDASINPYHYFYNSSNMSDIINNNKIKYQMPTTTAHITNDTLLRLYSLQLGVDTFISNDMLLQISIITSNPTIIDKCIDAYKSSANASNIHRAAFMINAINTRFNRDYSVPTINASTISSASLQLQSNLLNKIKQTQLLAMNAYMEEMGMLDDEESVASFDLPSPYMQLFNKQAYSSFNATSEECCYCKQSCAGEDYGYLSFLSINKHLVNRNTIFQISGCHVVHFRCTSLKSLYNSVKAGSTLSSNDLSNKLCITCPICRSLSNCYVPIIGKGTFNHSVSTIPCSMSSNFNSVEEVIKQDIDALQLVEPADIHLNHLILLQQALSKAYNPMNVEFEMILYGTILELEMLGSISSRNQQFYSHFFQFIRWYWSTAMTSTKSEDQFYNDMPIMLDECRLNNTSIFDYCKSRIQLLPEQEQLHYLTCTRIYLTIIMGLSTIDVNSSFVNKQDELFMMFNMKWNSSKLIKPALTKLPHKYEDFFVMDLRCRNCNKVPSQPALCLICGTITCFQVFDINLGSMLRRRRK
eukprot:NODE_13_length_42895_cov_0.518413.p3 type:complete len:1262 gc:universal NODE_13_length_42895_cov_0.518413:22956-19171(-)